MCIVSLIAIVAVAVADCRRRVVARRSRHRGIGSGRWKVLAPPGPKTEDLLMLGFRVPRAHFEARRLRRRPS